MYNVQKNDDLKCTMYNFFKNRCKDTTIFWILQTVFYIFCKKSLFSVGKVLVQVKKKQ